jgi:hypothetical protein
MPSLPQWPTFPFATVSLLLCTPDIENDDVTRLELSSVSIRRLPPAVKRQPLEGTWSPLPGRIREGVG